MTYQVQPFENGAGKTELNVTSKLSPHAGYSEGLNSIISYSNKT
jgi:hypothetical protein